MSNLLSYWRLTYPSARWSHWSCRWYGTGKWNVLVWIHYNILRGKDKAYGAYEGTWRNGGVAPRITYLVTWWKWVVSFTPGHFTRGEGFTYTNLIGDWGGPQSRSRCFGEQITLVHAGNRITIRQLSSPPIPTTLSRQPFRPLGGKIVGWRCSEVLHVCSTGSVTWGIVGSLQAGLLSWNRLLPPPWGKQDLLRQYSR
jgi:hypothetical protein